jgi:hypothetical protein
VTEYQKASFSHPKAALEPVTSRGKTVAPKLRHHKATGQAYAVLNNQAIYFGRYDSDEAVELYHKTIAEWVANGRQPDRGQPSI